MKQLIYGGLFFSLAILGSSCVQKEARYIDPNTGTALNLQEDSSGMMVNAETGQPVEIYVDRQTNDTLYGLDRTVINGRVSRGEDGRYVYLMDEDQHAAKDIGNGAAAAGGVAAPGSEPNEVKRKSGDYKYKGGKGEYKIKRPGYKKEVEKDGDITIKTPGKKIKIDGETGERKVKYDD